MPYLINGSAASLAPFRQSFVELPLGRDHNGIQLLSTYKQANLDFEPCSPALANQWLGLTNTGTSLISITILNMDATSYTAYSGVSLEATRPSFEAANVNGWSILVSGILP